MKFFIIVCLIASLAAIAWTGSTSFGKMNTSDYLLYRENVIRRPKHGSAWTVFVQYPQNGYIYNVNISAIFITDLIEEESGVQAKLTEGGPRRNFAKLILEAQYNQGIYSVVEIYGSQLNMTTC